MGMDHEVTTASAKSQLELIGLCVTHDLLARHAGKLQMKRLRVTVEVDQLKVGEDVKH